MIDKNLFLHDLAVVAILKDEGALSQGVIGLPFAFGRRPFLSDNQAEVVAPYVKAGLVDYFPYPSKAMQYAAYNDAVKIFKFHCRYMAFIDCDEFICSNDEETTDYSRGVLERFVRRSYTDWKVNRFTKLIVNPCKINFFCDPHWVNCFSPFHIVYEDLEHAPKNNHIVTKKNCRESSLHKIENGI